MADVGRPGASVCTNSFLVDKMTDIALSYTERALLKKNRTPSKRYNICTMLAQRRRRWADVVQMLYKCFVFA